MTDVVLHIGLHKTATRFLQRAVFASLDRDRFLVNPEPLFSTLKRTLRHPDSAAAARIDAAATEALQEAGNRTLVVSDPTISGDMYSSHADWQKNRDLVRRLFPEARIVYFVRRQSDWLHSAYRQALLKGPGIPIEFFLNYRDGEFHPRTARVIGGGRNVNALDLCFLDIYRGYAESFGPDKVYLFRQEDLRNRPEAVYARLAEALGLERLPPLPERVSGNKAFSALAIQLFFPGAYRSPTARQDTQSRPRFVGRMQRRFRKLRAMMIHHVFDRMIYRDWDLLARNRMRECIEAHYADENKALMNVADRILQHGPGSDAAEHAGVERQRAT